MYISATHLNSYVRVLPLQENYIHIQNIGGKESLCMHHSCAEDDSILAAHNVLKTTTISSMEPVLSQHRTMVAPVEGQVRLQGVSGASRHGDARGYEFQ